MNADIDRPDSLDELSGNLKAAVEFLKQRPVPEASMKRALERAGHGGLAASPAVRRVRPKAALGIATAVAACLAVAIWFSRPADLWADVVKAVQGKPWIHGTVRGAQPGESREFWISTSRAVGGARSAEQISYFDERLRITHRYDPQKKILYRLPSSAADLGQGQQLLEMFQGLFRGDAELKAELSDLILKNQKRKQIEKDGQRWDEHELVFRIPSRPDSDARMTFVVDRQTRLPHSMTMGRDGGDSVEWTFDYPEQGPVDVYALGVPRDAELVDRVPTGDMSRILAAMQAGRERFDDFHAIVLRSSSPSASSGPGQPIPTAFLVWKKGDRWRVEVGTPSPEFISKRIPAGKDEKEWMRAGCRQRFFRIDSVCDGKAVYSGNNFAFVAKADRAESSCPEAMRAMPATWCYPTTFPPPNDRTKEVVDTKPAGGPPKTILVTSRLHDIRSHDPARTLRFQRFWLDPLRGYAVVRRDALRDDPAIKPSTDREIQDVMDRWEQTPNGVWYPARVHAGSNGGEWYHFLLDFHADMPDDLFQPAKRTVLTDLYPVGS